MQLNPDLTPAQAYALAELCKRIGYADAIALAADEAEARAMLTAAELLRGALAEAGYTVR